MAAHSEIRELNLRAAVDAPIRQEYFEGKQWTVVPVVALVEGVIQAMNAPAPEFVPAEGFSFAPAGWNGRPVFLNHPMKDGKPVSGNTPDVLKTAIGKIFNARVEGKRLLMEAWLDPTKARDVIDRVLKDPKVEISTGAIVALSDEEGNYHGRSYRGRWSQITPDHLAILAKGLKGACSCEMGCGVRAAMNVVDGEDITILGAMPEGAERLVEGAKVVAKGKKGKVGKPHPNPNLVNVKHDDGTKKTYHKSVVRPALSARFDMTLQEKFTALLERIRPKKTAERAADDGGDAAEEQSELIQYQTMQTLLKQCGASYDEAMSLIDDLIAAEESDTAASADEEAEEEVETAQLNVIKEYCMSMMSTLSSVAALCRQLNAEDYPMLYGMRSAIGKRNSKNDQKLIQTVHDHSVSLGAACDTRTSAQKALGLKAMQTYAEGVGKTLETLNEEEATAALTAAEQAIAAAGEHSCGCGGRAANNHPEGEADMTKDERVQALSKNELSPIRTAAALTAMSEDELKALEAQVAKAVEDKRKADEKAAADRAAAAADAGKPKQKTEEEYLSDAPESIRTLVAESKARDAAERTELVGTLKAAQKVYSEAELNEKPLPELRKLAKAIAEVSPQQVDFGGRVPRIDGQNSGEKVPYIMQAPPDPYRIAREKKQAAAAGAQKEKVN